VEGAGLRALRSLFRAEKRATTLEDSIRRGAVLSALGLRPNFSK
jgi:hypothetical protein